MTRILSQIGLGLLSSSLVLALAACGAKDEATETEQGGALPSAESNSGVAAQEVALVDTKEAEEGCGGCSGEGEDGHADGEGCGGCDSEGEESHADGESCEGCGEEGGEGGHEHGEGQHGEVAAPAGNMGITLEDYTAISTILAKPEDFEGKRVLVKGKALKACEKRGCWVELESDKEFETLFVKVNDGEIVFPQECVGNEVIVEGEVQKLETEKGVQWRLRGLGAKFDS